jgi:hypothetical protein
LLKDGCSQQDIANHYSKEGSKCSRSKVQAFIREHGLGNTSLGTTAATPVMAIPDLPKPSPVIIPRPNIDPQTALYYEQRENEKLFRELTEMKRLLEDKITKYDELKEANRSLLEDARIIENTKPNALNGLVDSVKDNLPETLSSLAALVSSFKGIGTTPAVNEVNAGNNFGPNAQAYINHAVSILNTNANDETKLEKLVTLLDFAARPDLENWLNENIEMFKIPTQA